ncbi:MAG: polysaccharide deacetylase [Anaerovoracaceae bacterium]|nr:polysaccharide deacetylase [Anaerovoracaceae bacterium]
MQKVGKVKLPEGKKIALNLGFDFDSSSVWMESFGKTSMVYTSRGEYGAEIGVPRILNLLDKYDIKSTFFVPGHTIDTYPEVCKEILARGHEISHHGYVHEDPTDLPLKEEEEIFVKGLEALDRIGVKPLGYRSPGFDFSPNTISILEKYDIKYDSSLMGQDFYPYCPAPCKVNFDKGNEFGEPSKIVEMPASWYMDDFPHSEFIMTRTGMKPQSQIFEIWSTTFDYGVDNTQNGLLNVAMHPQVIGRPHNIVMLEKFIRHALDRGAWIAPFAEIYKAVEF